MAIYTAVVSQIAVAAAQDVFEIVAGSASRVRIREIRLGQYTDVGDAAAETLSVQIIRGSTTSGSGGGTVTPTNISGHSGALAAASTVERNNTTLAQDGTGAVLLSDVWNIAAGWWYYPPEEEMPILDNSQRLVVRISAPADSITTNATLVFEEIAQIPG